MYVQRTKLLLHTIVFRSGFIHYRFKVRQVPSRAQQILTSDRGAAGTAPNSSFD